MSYVLGANIPFNIFYFKTFNGCSSFGARRYTLHQPTVKFVIYIYIYISYFLTQEMRRNRDWMLDSILKLNVFLNPSVK
jgi:hypothetical protein